MRRIATAGLAVALMSLWSASAAWAGHHPIPPGNSGAGQYTENIPGAGGSNPSHGGPSNGTGAGGGSSLPPGTASSLQAQGADGAGAAAFAESTAPRSGAGAASSGSSPSGPGTSPSASHAASGSTLGDLTKQVTGGSDDGGMGLALPIILMLTALGAIGLAVVRRGARGRTTPPAG